ncbi:hypothetical protein MUK42_10938, partial [Musa troglodytarum]
HALRRSWALLGLRRALLRLRRLRRGVHHGVRDQEPRQGHPTRPRRCDVHHHPLLLPPGAHPLPHAALLADRPQRALLGRVRGRRYGLGQVHRRLRRTQRHDDRPAGVGRRPSSVPHPHRSHSHGAAMVRSSPRLHRHPHQRHRRHARSHSHHRPLYGAQHPLQSPLHLDALHLHAGGGGSPRPAILRQRRILRGRAEQADSLHRAHPGLLGGGCRVLGGGRRRVGGVRGGDTRMVPLDGIPVAGGATGEEAEAVGGAAGAVVAVGVHRHQYLPAGLDRRAVVYEVWHMDGAAARLLFLFGAARII